ncbi:MAG: polysaccharide deacetylase family protein [Bacteroidetes bacterium]|nr:polysaccharide deacetylase family protein [Bacteroidota bacterium]
MIRIFFLVLLNAACAHLWGQSFNPEQEKSAPGYLQEKKKTLARLGNLKPGKFGEVVPGVIQKLGGSGKIVALTFDACGGPTGSGYDKELIDYLKHEKIPATLFISGRWIEKNPLIFKQLCDEPLFEIENHGLTHRPLTVAGEAMYKITGTKDGSQAYDEIELNARQIQFYSHRKPKYFRPGTATADEGAMAIANALGVSVVGFSVLSNDALVLASKELIKTSVLNKVCPGAIIIMHMNHPERNSFEALQEIISILKSQGFQFTTIEKFLKRK